MKQKIFIQISSLISVAISGLLLTLPIFVFATSGACSWHGGVDCAAGADWDGSVICNDGWRDSKVSFFDTVECYEAIRCSLSQLESLLDEYRVPAIKNELNNINREILNITKQINELIIEMNQKLLDVEQRMVGRPGEIMRGEQTKIEKEYNSKISLLSSQISLLKSEYNLKNDSLDLTMSIIEGKCKALGYDNEQQRMLDRIKIMEELQKQLQAKSCPANSYYSNEQCFCNEGYIASGSVCITYSQNCQMKYGQNSYGDKQHCYCSTGYEFNSGKTACVKIETQRNQEILSSKESERQQQEQINQQIQQMQPEMEVLVIETEQDTSEGEKTENENQDKQNNQQKKGILESVSGLLANIYNAFTGLFSRIFNWLF